MSLSIQSYICTLFYNDNGEKAIRPVIYKKSNNSKNFSTACTHMDWLVNL